MSTRANQQRRPPVASRGRGEELRTKAITNSVWTNHDGSYGPKRIGAIIDEWCTDTYIEAQRVQRLLHLEGRELDPRHMRVLEFLLTDFLDSFKLQMAFMATWLHDGRARLRPDADAAPYAGHNWEELEAVYEVWANVLDTWGEARDVRD